MDQYKLHDAIIYNVNELIENEKKRITILVPTGCGKTILMGRIVQSFHLTTIIIVPRESIRDSLAQRKKTLFGSQSVTILTVSEFARVHANIQNTQPDNAFWFFLFDTTPKEREDLARFISSDASVISFGYDHRTKDETFEDSSFFPFECCVFYTKTLFDVRDFIVAPEDERQTIVDQIKDRKNSLERLLLIIRTAPFNASPDASKEELDAIKERLKERDKVIAEKEETIQTLKSLLAAAGIPTDEIMKAVDSIKRIKENYEKVDAESIVEKISEAISEQSQMLFAPYINSYSKEYYSSLIESSITKDVWNKMKKESQTCLVTGKIAFQSMMNIGDPSLDYSGVCILASKALDIEMSKRFFYNYVQYLRGTCQQSLWPKSLFDQDGNLLTDDKFTLGSIRFVVGIDEKGTVKNSYANRSFIKYAKTELYDSAFPKNDIKKHLRKCIESIETVREKYRNPAAHRTSLNQITAKECFDYLVDTYKKLKEILEVMK